MPDEARMARILWTAVLIVQLTAGGFRPAIAFDPRPSTAPDKSFCFYKPNDPRWDAETWGEDIYPDSDPKGEMRKAVGVWNNEVGTDFRQPPRDTPCSEAQSDVFVLWANGLSGRALGRSYGGTIVFAAEKHDRPVPWSFKASGPHSSEFDFRGVAVHEVGHELRLRHPEADESFHFRSCDGKKPIMRASGVIDGETALRRPKKDDLAGGLWAVDRQYATHPDMSDISHWRKNDATLTQCNPAYACLRPDGGRAQMTLTTRMTTDRRLERRTPTVTVRWRDYQTEAGGTLKVKMRYRQKMKEGDKKGPWTDAGHVTCSDSNPPGLVTWQTCSAGPFGLGDFKVQDIRLVLSTSRDIVHIDDVRIRDG